LNTILEDFSPAKIIAAMEINSQEQALLWARALDVEVHEDAGVRWFISGLPYALCNGIVDAHFSARQANDNIDTILEHLNSFQVPMACVITPSTQPADLAQRLQRFGWQAIDADPGMALDLHTLGPQPGLAHDVHIRQVVDEATLKDMIRVLIVGSELPEDTISFLLDLYKRRGFPRDPAIRFYVAYRGDEAVATALLFLSGGAAGIYNVATLEHARRQGIGSATTYAALLAARDKGYRIGVLQSSPMGLNVYRRLGFVPYCTFHFYFHT
jgi:GNAT superfamily N-acetyltransferase